MFSIRARIVLLACIFSALTLLVSCGDDPPTKPPDEKPATWSLDLPADGDDAISDVAELADGNYLALGYTNSNGANGEDFYAVKFTVDGDTLWTRKYGGSGGDIGTKVLATPDGGAVLGGLSNSFGSNGLDVWIVRIDSLGDTLWSHTFGGSGLDRVHDMLLRSDNTIVIAGVLAEGSEHRAWLAGIASDGGVLWEKQYLGLHTAELKCLVELPGKLLFTGGDRGSGSPTAFWQTVNVNADSIASGWYYLRGGYHVQSMLQGMDGRFTIAGWHNPGYVESRNDFFAMRVDEFNNMQWEVRLGGAEDDECFEIIELPDGNLKMIGNTRSYDGSDWDLYTITIDTTGALVDEKVYKDDLENPMSAICPTPDGRYIIVGSQAPSIGAKTDIMIRKIEL